MSKAFRKLQREYKKRKAEIDLAQRELNAKTKELQEAETIARDELKLNWKAYEYTKKKVNFEQNLLEEQLYEEVQKANIQANIIASAERTLSHSPLTLIPGIRVTNEFNRTMKLFNFNKETQKFNLETQEENLKLRERTLNLEVSKAYRQLGFGQERIMHAQIELEDWYEETYAEIKAAHSSFLNFLVPITFAFGGAFLGAALAGTTIGTTIGLSATTGAALGGILGGLYGYTQTPEASLHGGKLGTFGVGQSNFMEGLTSITNLLTGIDFSNPLSGTQLARFNNQPKPPSGSSAGAKFSKKREAAASPIIPSIMQTSGGVTTLDNLLSLRDTNSSHSQINQLQNLFEVR